MAQPQEEKGTEMKIKCDYTPERHGAMWDLKAAETVSLSKGELKAIPLGICAELPANHFGLVVPRSSTCIKYGIMMANSVGIIDSDYNGDNDVWAFLAYAIRDTTIEAGTRIAQFMPVPEAGSIWFDHVDTLGNDDRGGFGSTDEPQWLDRNGKELHVGDFVFDDDQYPWTVVELYTDEGDPMVTVHDGSTRAHCFCEGLEVDNRPRDREGVPIKIGDTMYIVDEDGTTVHDCSTVVTEVGGPNGLVRLRAADANGWSGYYSPSRLTHEGPDSFEAIAEDAVVLWGDYCVSHGIDVDENTGSEERAMVADLLRRMKAVAARD